jgi:Tol biopolymer transport system component
MGEVYRARDPRLGRDVALKVLPPDAAADPERLERFRHEARAVAALSHPHILAIHDVGSDDGVDYVVFELLEGQTLRRRLESGPLPARKVVDYGVQACRGLAAAHEHGVVHRDLKPENLFLAADGQVKILDFGLARQAGPAGDDELTRAETRTAVTEAGRVMGTAGYMSPEQAQGQRADARSDIFALGAVLYEMLSGRRAFAGATPMDTLAAVLRSDPPEIEADGVPPGLERVVRRCLEKDPGERFQSAHDLGLALETLAGPAPPAPRSDRRRRIAGLALAVAVFFAVATAATWLVRNRGPEREPAAPIRIVPLTADGGLKFMPRLSPDGERVAYSWSGPDGDSWHLYVKGLGQGTRPIRLTDHVGDIGPTWSPDGRQVAFVRRTETGTAIYTVPSYGGQENRLIDVVGPLSMPDSTFIAVLSWSPDGQWLALPERPRPDDPARIVRVPLASPEKRALTFPPAGTLGDLCPELSPDGRTLAFARSASRAYGAWDVWLQGVDGSPARQLTFGRYDACCGLSWTPNGKEVVFSTSNGWQGGQMLRVPVTGGTPSALAGIGGNVAWPSVRGSRMVHAQLTPTTADIWRLLARGATGTDRQPKRLISSRWDEGAAAYSPDGRRIAFNSDRSGTWNVWVCDEDGTNPVQLAAFDEAAEVFGAPWSADGRRITFISGEAHNAQIYVVDAEGGVPRRLTHEPSQKSPPSFSRDGRVVYFGSDRTGRWEIWRVPADGGTAIQLTRGGGYFAQESWDGRHVYYSKTFIGGGLWRMPVAGGNEAAVPGATPRDWSRWALSRTGVYWTTESSQIGYAQDHAIRFLDFQSGRVRTLFRKRGPFGWIWPAISPDERWILVREWPDPECELMLVENFR